MKYTDKSKDYSLKYAKEKLKRVPLDLQLSDYERLKAAAISAGQSVNGFIKQSIDERIEREGLPVGGSGADGLPVGTDLLGGGGGGYSAPVSGGVSAKNTAKSKKALLDLLD